MKFKFKTILKPDYWASKYVFCWCFRDVIHDLMWLWSRVNTWPKSMPLERTGIRSLSPYHTPEPILRLPCYHSLHYKAIVYHRWTLVSIVARAPLKAGCEDITKHVHTDSKETSTTQSIAHIVLFTLSSVRLPSDTRNKIWNSSLQPASWYQFSKSPSKVDSQAGQICWSLGRRLLVVFFCLLQLLPKSYLRPTFCFPRDTHRVSLLY